MNKIKYHPLNKIETIMPIGAMGKSLNDSMLISALRKIALKAGKHLEQDRSDKYGVDFENDVFMMHTYCWCEDGDCKWCFFEEPNFIYKPANLRVWWYKYIGRGMALNMDITDKETSIILQKCLESIS